MTGAGFSTNEKRVQMRKIFLSLGLILLSVLLPLALQGEQNKRCRSQNGSSQTGTLCEDEHFTFTVLFYQCSSELGCKFGLIIESINGPSSGEDGCAYTYIVDCDNASYSCYGDFQDTQPWSSLIGINMGDTINCNCPDEMGISIVFFRECAQTCDCPITGCGCSNPIWMKLLNCKTCN